MKTRLALLLPLVALASCAQNNASVRVAAICAAPTDPTTCTFTGTCSAQSLDQTTIDVGLTNRLWMLLQVDNLLPNNANAGSYKTNTNDAFVQEYDVEYVGLPIPNSTGSVLGSAMVPAAGSAVISVPAINESVGTLLQGGAIPAGSQVDLVAKLRLKGVLADTTQFETGVFQIPIRVCNGCLGAALTCTAPAVPVYCPPNPGQLPGSSKCVTP